MADAEPRLAEETTLTITRVLAAPRDRVFRAFTDPQELTAWFGPADGYTVPACDVDLRVGGRYRIDLRAPSGNLYRIVGTYREIRPPERLVYTWRWEIGDDVGETLVTIELDDLGDATELRLTHERFPDVRTRDGHGAGWSGSFDRLSCRITSASSKS